MILYILRGASILLAASVTTLYVISWQTELAEQNRQVDFLTVVLMLGLTLGITGAIIAIDVFAKRKKLAAVSGVFLGLIAGLLAAYALSFVVDLIGVLFSPVNGPARESFHNLLQGVKVLIGLITCYIGISLVIQTKDDFRFVIPYVEFAKEIRGNRPTLLDTSVIVDGRILDIIETKSMQGVLVVAKFVLDELQTIADSSDKLRRARGRRGLEVLQKLQAGHLLEVLIDEREVEGGNVDQKLIRLAQAIQGRVMTNDYNLNKIATLHGVEVINLNDLAKALRPVVLPGEHLQIKLVKSGEGPTQGIGYLTDGTMIVVEGGKMHLGESCDIVVTSTLQTSAGRMIFGRYNHSEPPSEQTPEPIPHPDTTDLIEPSQPIATETTRRPTRASQGRNPRRGR